MRYVVLIYGSESHLATLTPPAMAELIARWTAFNEGFLATGIVQASGRLRPTPSASTLRVRGGKVLTTDGPFAETKEQLGGFYVIDVPSLDHALDWARKMPTAEFGAIEVRPIWEREDYAK